ncbi:PXA domain-containing protein [Zalerion maritima]|uniref:PXA domain-containing protein n=1 Tax=Zalerion maritima TaxID=339359 RepID=A0AAD5WN98_9PEZI|nr:PXA domain-containing protein [Zalerion maritima]
MTDPATGLNSKTASQPATRPGTPASSTAAAAPVVTTSPVVSHPLAGLVAQDSSLLGPRRPARPPATDPLSDKATLFLIRRTLCSDHPREKGRTSPAPIEDLLPPLTSRNDVDLQLYAFLSIILREFVQSWYNKITPDQSFVNEIVHIIAHITRALEQRIRKVDLEHLLFQELPELLDNHINGLSAPQPNLHHHDPSSFIPPAPRSATRQMDGHPVQSDPRRVYHSLSPLPHLSPVPDNRNPGTVSEQEENESNYRQLLVQGVLAVLLPTEDLENECLTSLVGQILSELIIGGIIAKKASEPWLLWEGITILARDIGRKMNPEVDVIGLDNSSASSVSSRQLPPHDGLEVDKPEAMRLASAKSAKGSSRGAWSIDGLFWSLIHWAFLGYSIIRFLVSTAILSRSLPSRLGGSATSYSSSHMEGMTGRSDRSKRRPLEEGRQPVKRPILALAMGPCMSNLLELDSRMPWLCGVVSWAQWMAIRGPGQIAGLDGIVDRAKSLDSSEDSSNHEYWTLMSKPTRGWSALTSQYHQTIAYATMGSRSWRSQGGRRRGKQGKQWLIDVSVFHVLKAWWESICRSVFLRPCLDGPDPMCELQLFWRVLLGGGAWAGARRDRDQAQRLELANQGFYLYKLVSYSTTTFVQVRRRYTSRPSESPVYAPSFRRCKDGATRQSHQPANFLPFPLLSRDENPQRQNWRHCAPGFHDPSLPLLIPVFFFPGARFTLVRKDFILSNCTLATIVAAHWTRSHMVYLALFYFSSAVRRWSQQLDLLNVTSEELLEASLTVDEILRRALAIEETRLPSMRLCSQTSRYVWDYRNTSYSRIKTSFPPPFRGCDTIDSPNTKGGMFPLVHGWTFGIFIVTSFNSDWLGEDVEGYYLASAIAGHPFITSRRGECSLVDPQGADGTPGLVTPTPKQKWRIFISIILAHFINTELFDAASVPPILRTLRGALFPNNAPGTPTLIPPENEESLLKLRRKCARTVLKSMPRTVARIVFAGTERALPHLTGANGENVPVESKEPATAAQPDRSVADVIASGKTDETGKVGGGGGKSGPSPNQQGRQPPAPRTSERGKKAGLAVDREISGWGESKSGHGSASSSSMPAATQPVSRSELEGVGRRPVFVVANYEDDNGGGEEEFDETDQVVLDEIEMRILDVFGDAYCNKHLMYSALELILVRLLPELGERGIAEMWEERLS